MVRITTKHIKKLQQTSTKHTNQKNKTYTNIVNTTANHNNNSAPYINIVNTTAPHNNQNNKAYTHIVNATTQHNNHSKKTYIPHSEQNNFI